MRLKIKRLGWVILSFSSPLLQESNFSVEISFGFLSPKSVSMVPLEQGETKILAESHSGNQRFQLITGNSRLAIGIMLGWDNCIKYTESSIIQSCPESSQNLFTILQNMEATNMTNPSHGKQEGQQANYLFFSGHSIPTRVFWPPGNFPGNFNTERSLFQLHFLFFLLF